MYEYIRHYKNVHQTDNNMYKNVAKNPEHLEVINNPAISKDKKKDNIK